MLEVFNHTLEYLMAIIVKADIITLFFALLLGALFAPINRETIIVFMSVVATTDVINPLVGFIVTTAAIYFGYSLLFFLGRWFKVLEKKLFANPSYKTKKKLERSYQLLEKYGTTAIIVSYFVPGARHLLPIVLGTTTMPAGKFMFTSKIGSIIWTATFYLPGYLLGDVWT